MSTDRFTKILVIIVAIMLFVNLLFGVLGNSLAPDAGKGDEVKTLARGPIQVSSHRF